MSMMICGLSSGRESHFNSTGDDDLLMQLICSDAGASSGTGTTCIKSPDDGTCGCEDSDGTFVYGSDSCT